MATKTIRLPVTVVIADPKNSIYEETKDPQGKVVSRKALSIFPMHVEAGQPVELDADEADALVAKYGAFKPSAASELLPGTPSPVKVHSARNG